MKQAYFVAALLLAGTPFSNAVDFNNDAMKSMQKQGHEIVAQSKSSRAYKAKGNLCLDVAGKALLVKACNANRAAQQWRLDDKSRLVAGDGRCVAGASLQKCGNGKGQQWKYDGNKRLANGNSQCLKRPGNPVKAGTKVVAAACTKAANQVWN